MLFVYSSANVSPSISARPESRWAMHAGSCTAWSTVSSRTDRCPVTRQSEAAMTRSTRSSVRREQGNTCQEPCLSTWSPLLLVSRTIHRRMTFDRKLTFSSVVKNTLVVTAIFTGQPSHAPLATEYVCFLRVIRHEDAALKCISWLIVMKCNMDIRVQYVCFLRVIRHEDAANCHEM